MNGAQGASKPTPCLGGSDQSGTTGASHWAQHLRRDLATVECAIVTRADHFNPANRTYDVHVPVTFDQG